MKVTFDIVKQMVEPFVTITAMQKTPDLIELGQTIEDFSTLLMIEGHHDDRTVSIAIADVIRFHTAGKSVVCETATGTYQIRQRIYELAERLSKRLFIQISSSEIVRISCIKQFDLGRGGIFLVRLTSDEVTYTSRRYAQTLKRRLLK
ncbi:LytTR family DNA-binding domain-containing protein [Furfurilactobacillus entadae]|uniref:LytTR family DNA-binding domain-containing protein n=1 Tax=Furfurilactobacillus entadae TaxID=2922307 RepID=UPI0035E9D85E